jgi:hypothetical protein
MRMELAASWNVRHIPRNDPERGGDHRPGTTSEKLSIPPTTKSS